MIPQCQLSLWIHHQPRDKDDKNYNSHFTDEETEALKGHMICPRSQQHNSELDRLSQTHSRAQ